MSMGVPAERLSDEELRHELLHLKETQDDIAGAGTAHQQQNHRQRTAELEAEFTRRFAGHDGADSGITDAPVEEQTTEPGAAGAEPERKPASDF